MTLREIIDNWMHFSLLANDETFSDIYGEKMCEQEKERLSKAILEWVKSIVPEEKETSYSIPKLVKYLNEPIPEIHISEMALGWNSCRKTMLERLEGE